MGWARYTHASVSMAHPRALGVCDRCGFVYNHDDLQWQYQWAGPKLQNLRILVCKSCLDEPQEQLRTIILPPDPIPISNPRPGEFGSMVISSHPGDFQSIVPSQIVVESSVEPDLGTIGDRTPIVTQNTSRALLTEITVTPNPDPNFGDGGYTRGSTEEST